MKKIIIAIFSLALCSSRLFGQTVWITTTWHNEGTNTISDYLGYTLTFSRTSSSYIDWVPVLFHVELSPGSTNTWTSSTTASWNGTSINNVDPAYLDASMYSQGSEHVTGYALIRTVNNTSGDNLYITADAYVHLPGETPPVYTNFTFCANNTLGQPAIATWTYNGSVVKTETLAVGAGDCWTTPTIEVSPTPQDFTESTSVKLGSTGTSAGIDGTGGPTIDFNPPAGGGNTTTGSGGTTSDGGGGTAGGTAGGTGSTGTNSYTPPPYDGMTAPTNLVTFGTPSSTNGSASESTLNSGFQLLHKDLLGLQTDVGVLDKDVNGGFYTVSNQLGQIVTYAYSNELIDGMWLPKIFAAITNQNFPTNLVSGSTNTFSLTNYATETTQEGISNLLAGMSTNAAQQSTLEGISNLLATTNSVGYSNLYTTMVSLVPSTATNASSALSAATAAEGDYGVDSLLSSLTPNLPSPVSSAPNMTVVFGGVTYDLDPSHEFPAAVAVSYDGLKLFASLFFLLDVSRLFFKVVQTKSATQTGGVPDLEVFGGVTALSFGGEIGGNFLGAVVAVLIPVAFIAGFSLVMGYIFSHLGVSVTDAMNLSGWTAELGNTAYYLLSTFIPINFLFSLVCTRITLQFTMGKILSVASNAARFLWGK